MAKTSKKYAGCLFAQNVNASGVASGPIFKMGNAYPLSLQMSVSANEMISAMCDTAGQLLEVRNEIDSNSGELTLYQYGAAEIGYALGATPVAMTGVGSTIADEDVTAPDPGDWAELGHKNLSAFVLKDATDAITYVEGTDYLINTHLGVFTTITGGAIVADATLHWSATEAAESGYKLEMGTVLQNNLRIFGSLKDIRIGNKVAVNLKCVSLTAKNGVTLISEPKTEYESLSFELKLITPSGQTSPATIEGITAD